MKNLSIIKMKKPIILLALIPFLFINACKKDDDVNPDNNDNTTPSIELGIPDSMSIVSNGSEQGIAFESNVSWKATTNVDWINILNSSGDKGKDTLRFSVDENTGDARSGKITISSDQEEVSKDVKVIQQSGLSDNFFVKVEASGNGHSWVEATSLTKALDQASEGDTIFVAAGTYHPTEMITGGSPSDNGDKTFEIFKNITLIGGFSANASKGASANPEDNLTILSGDLGSGDSAYHVISITAPKTDGKKVVIQGFKITAGSAKGSGKFQIGGVTFYRDNGGGLSIGNSNVEIKNCDIVENNGDHASGAMFVNSGKVSIWDSKINKNTSGEGSGGAIWIYGGAELTLYNCEVNNNISGGTAGAIYAYPDAKLVMYNTEVKNNKGTSYGAAVYYRESDGVLVNCLITGNSSTSGNGGGGLMMYGGCEVGVVSTTITGNTISGPGGGIYRKGGTNKLYLINSIVSGNTQISGSSDVDAGSGQPDATIVSTVIDVNAYNGLGAEITGVSFDASSDLNADFVPTGSSNPALTDGMDASTLSTAASVVSYPIENAYLTSDLNGNSRTGKTIMGALVQ